MARIPYKRLEELLSEMREHISDQDEDLKMLYSDLHYLTDFIQWKGLSDEYQYFKENAHMECPENVPFGSYVL